MILYAENPEDSTKQQQQQKKPLRSNKFSKFAGYKLNIQISVIFLYMKNELTKEEIKKSRPCMFKE